MRAFAAFAVASAKTALGSAARRHVLSAQPPRSHLVSAADAARSRFLGCSQPWQRTLSSAAPDTIDISFLAGGDVVHCKVSPLRPRAAAPPHLDTAQGVIGDSILATAHKNNVDLEGACEGSLACR